MRRLIVPAAMVAGLFLGQAAFAAAPAPAAKVQPASQTASAKSKREACQRSWKEQKTHKGTEKAYVSACMKKG